LAGHPSDSFRIKHGQYDQEYEADFHLDTAQFSLRFPGDPPRAVQLQDDQCSVENPDDPENNLLKTGIGKMRCKSIRFMRDYMHFLYTLPLNLQDANMEIRSEVRKEEFGGRETLSFQAYFPGDKYVWEFFFDPNTYALVGTSFSKDAARSYGEFIVFEGEINAHGIRLPRHRKWHFYQDGQYIATDELRDLKLRKGK
ncbi:MAG: hypothetical protein AAF570_07330, partial [Bacteroidota bacterium]